MKTSSSNDPKRCTERAMQIRHILCMHSSFIIRVHIPRTQVDLKTFCIKTENFPIFCGLCLLLQIVFFYFDSFSYSIITINSHPIEIRHNYNYHDFRAFCSAIIQLQFVQPSFSSAYKHCAHKNATIMR